MHTFKTLHVLALPQVHLLDLAGPAQVFSSARLAVDIQYISPVAEMTSAQGLKISNLEELPEAVEEGTCLMVVGSQEMQQRLASRPVRRTVSWLKKFAQRYQHVAAVCSGSIVLGQAGLLDHVQCTTHHDLIETLRRVAPNAKVEENCLFIEDGHIVTSAGITTGIDLSLHLVNRFFGPVAAQGIARDMVVYQRRDGQSQSMSFWLQHRNHVEKEVHAIQDKIMQHPGGNWRPKELASIACLSERQFRRRFLQATGQSFQNYLQLARLELSKQLLRQKDLSIETIAERCGFADERGLRRLWQLREGQSPSNFRKINGL